MELYKKHRPKRFKQVVGQRDAVKTLEKLLKDKDSFPHCILLTGPSGCGKTTLARILQNKLSCGDHDFTEVDCADFRGIDMVRDIRQRMHLAPMSGKCRIWLIDEAHQLTGEAQNALLKMLEDTPQHVYFMLATTDPAKLKKTIKTRATEIKVDPLAKLDMQELLATIADKESLEISERVAALICDVADGSARKALVLLNQIAKVEDEDEQLKLIRSSDSQEQAITIARSLMAKGMTWKSMAKVLKGVDEDPEQLRRMVLGYATTIMLSGGPLTPLAFLVINEFRDPFYDIGRPGLVAACYSVITARKR